VRDFQSVVGREVRAQIVEAEGRLPDLLIACTGGGSNSLGLFHPFLDDAAVAMIGVEAGGRGTHTTSHAARFAGGEVGIIEGYKSYFLQTPEGQVRATHSVSAGLDYAGIGPELAYLHDVRRVTFAAATDAQAINAFTTLMRSEGIIPALESSHAVAHALLVAPAMRRDQLIVVNVSGRGDKDIFIVAEYLNDPDWKAFLRDMAEGKWRNEIV
jgi:tryptophan synthase beta chain